MLHRAFDFTRASCELDLAMLVGNELVWPDARRRVNPLASAGSLNRRVSCQVTKSQVH